MGFGSLQQVFICYQLREKITCFIFLEKRIGENGYFSVCLSGNIFFTSIILKKH